MTLFKANEAIENTKQARAAKTPKPKGKTQMELLAEYYGEKIDRLESRLSRVETDVSGLKEFRSDQESFNAGTKQRHAKTEKQLAGMGASAVGGRQCPECDEIYPDGPGFWPGYTSKTHPGVPACLKCFPKDDA